MNPGAEIYLDNNATTQALPEVRAAVARVLASAYGNPSSAHSTGERARSQLEQAREAIGTLIGAQPDEVVFTSGGTESNNIVLWSYWLRYRDQLRVATSTVEHSSVLNTCRRLEELGATVSYLPVDGSGHLSRDRLADALRDGPALVSIQWVNNETGVVQPIEEFLTMCHGAGAVLHTDAAQAAGKLHLDIEQVPVDYLTLTAHKFHGPQGVGALYARDPATLRSVFGGGPQERGLRPGTENLSGIVGMGVAAARRRDRLREVCSYLGALRDEFERLVAERIPGVRLNGRADRRVCNTANLMFPGIDGQALVARLDQAGIRCSQSSACTNRRPEPSYVLRAMGLSEEEAYSSLRFSFSELNRREEIERAVKEIERTCGLLARFKLRKTIPSPAAEVA